MIIVDVGRENVKVLPENNQPFSFPSRIGEGRELNLKNEPGHWLSQIDLNINNKRYFVGDLAEESRFSRGMRTANKDHEETKILFSAALFLGNYKSEEKIITLIPINQHKDKAKDLLKKTVVGEYEIKSRQRGKVFNITGDNLDVTIEGIAGIWDMLLNENLEIKKDFIGKTIRAIELGSRTIHLATLYWKNGKFNYLDKESDTLEYGCMELNKRTTDEEKMAFVRRIKDDASVLWNSWHSSEPLFLLGGGVLKLEEELRGNFIDPEFHPHPLYANVLGAKKLGMIRYAKRTT